MSALEDYLRLVYPWDPEHENYWKCCAADFVDKQGERSRISVAAAQTFDDTVRMIRNRIKWNKSSVYMAIGIQKISDQSKNDTNDGFPRANKSAANMHSLKALFIDVDVDPKKNATYDTTEQAIEGFGAFLQDSGMPMPTFIVWSGSGGFHAYWILDKPLLTDDWKVMASGLKACCKRHGFLADPAITDDAARILRTPTSFNNKRASVEVEMVVTEGEPIYTASELWTVLGQYATAQAQRTGTGTVHNLSANARGFTENVEENAKPVPVDDLALVCPAVKAALDTGGAGYQEPQWMIDLYVSAFTTDPRDAAHRMSKGHADYTEAGTDAKLAEQQAKKGTMGWPSCATIAGKGHAECAICPFFTQGKSPFHFVKPAQKQRQSYTRAYPGGDRMLPEDGRYWRNDQNRIITFDEQSGPIDVLGWPVLDAGIDAETNAIAYKTLVQGNERWFTVGFAGQTKPGQIIENFHKGSYGAVVIDRPSRLVRDFTMAWLKHLTDTKQFLAATGMGWDGTDFLFGDKLYTPTGPMTAYRRTPDPQKIFDRVGALKPWQDAMQLVYGNTSLECIVASAFAGPIVNMISDFSVVLSAFSFQSAFGKTTAMKIAQSVWGHPRIGMNALTDTENSVMGKLRELRHLPEYWDELKTSTQMQQMVSVVFGATQGKSKARMKQDATQAPIGSFTTMFVVASNHGIFTDVTRNTGRSNAGGLRVFEIKMLPLIPKVYSEDLIIDLNENYGSAGAHYADWLVRNRDCVFMMRDHFKASLKARCKFNSDERFWEATMVALLTGAALAVGAELADFDLAAMENYLVQTFLSLRVSLRTQVETLSGPNAGSEVLAHLTEDTRLRNMIETPTVWNGMGRPPSLPNVVVDISKVNVWLQYGVNDGCFLIRRAPFHEWLTEHKYQIPQVLELLRQDFIVTEPPMRQIGAGVNALRSAQRAACYHLEPKVPPGASHNPSDPSANFGSPSP